MNYFKTLFDRGQDPERRDWACWQMTTSENPYIDPAEVESARLDMKRAILSRMCCICTANISVKATQPSMRLQPAKTARGHLKTLRIGLLGSFLTRTSFSSTPTFASSLT